MPFKCSTNNWFRSSFLSFSTPQARVVLILILFLCIVSFWTWEYSWFHDILFVQDVKIQCNISCNCFPLLLYPNKSSTTLLDALESLWWSLLWLFWLRLELYCWMECRSKGVICNSVVETGSWMQSPRKCAVEVVVTRWQSLRRDAKSLADKYDGNTTKPRSAMEVKICSFQSEFYFFLLDVVR